MTHPASTPKPKRSLRSILEPLALVIMTLGGLMMVQPFALVLYSYSFTILLAGTLMFIVVSHFPE